MLDIFANDAFGMVSLTDSMMVLPHKPKRLGELGIFVDQPITTTSVAIEEKDGQLSLLPFKARNSAGTTEARTRRRLRTFEVPHVPHDAQLLADDLNGVRAFGQEDIQEVFSSILAEKMQGMRANHEVTHEHHRAAALQGLLLDADGSTYYDFFAEFGISETVKDFAFTTGTTDIKNICTDILRTTESNLGNDTFTGVHCLCGKDFFDSLTSHATVKAAYDRWRDGQFLRETQFRQVFSYGGITFEEYRGQVGSRIFIADDVARFYPTGSGLTFKRYIAPAPFIETVGTLGKLIYVKQTRMKNDIGIEIHSQSNPLTLCRRPRVLIKGTMS